MSATWPKVRLGDVLTRSEITTAIDPTRAYREITVKLWGKGAVLRGVVAGAAIASVRRFVAKSGQLILSRIDARNGATAVVPNALDGAVVTNDFPLFDPRASRLNIEYLGWLARTRLFVELCKRASEGTTNRVRLQEDRFLQLEIGLPPLDEQQRIVARIEELAAKITEARQLRAGAVSGAQAIRLSTLHGFFSNPRGDWQSMPMREVALINDKQVDPTLPEYCDLPHISGENIESATGRLLPWRTAAQDGVRSGNYLFAPGAVLYSKIRPYLRKAALVDFRGVCSADMYPVRVSTERVDPQFFKWSLIAEPFTAYANKLSGRTRMPKLNRDQFFGYRFLCPPLSEQRRIVAHLDALQAKVDALKVLQQQTAAELDALLPAILDRAFKGELLGKVAEPAASPSAQPARPSMQQARIHGPNYRDRAAVAAKLVKQLSHNPLGKPRYVGALDMEKSLFFLESHYGVKLGGRYRKLNYGPFDPDARTQVETLGQANGWLDLEKEDGTLYCPYRLGANADEALAHAMNVLGDKLNDFTAFIAMARKWKSKEPELYATLYAVWNDLLFESKQPSLLGECGSPPTTAAIKARFFGWHPSKGQNFTDAQVITGLIELERLELVPQGNRRLIVE